MKGRKKALLLLGVLVTITHIGCGGSQDLAIRVTRSSSLQPAGGVVLISGDKGSSPAYAVDMNGKVVATYPFETHSGNYHPIPIQPLPNGNLVVVSATGAGVAPCDDCPVNNIVQEMDLTGAVVWQISNKELQDALTARGYAVTLTQISHEAIGLPNGHLMVLATNVRDIPGEGKVQGAVLIDLDQDHQPVWVWDTFDHLDTSRHPYFKLPDWIHGNAITYSPDDGNLLFSARAQSWILKLDYRNGTGTGNILWKLGYQGDFTLLDGGPADWFYGQHAPIFLSSNSAGVFQLGMFDNGNSRIMNDAGARCGDSGQPACYSTVPIFEIDENNRTARVLWRDKLNFFSNAVGNMQVLENGHVWFDAGRVGDLSIIREVTREANPQTVLQMQVNTIVYRAIHVPAARLGL